MFMGKMVFKDSEKRVGLPLFLAKRFTIVVLAVVVVSCGGNGSSGDNTSPNSQHEPYTYSIPEDNGDGWPVGDLSEEGFDTQMIIDLMNDIRDGSYPGIDSIAITRNGKLLLYWFDRQRELDVYDGWIGNTIRERHVLNSTSKSFTSALIGIAIDHGYIASTEVSFLSLFPYASYDNWDDRKDDITLEDALTMRLGFTWDESSRPYNDPENDLVYLENNNVDWPKALLDLPMSSNPGTTFAYSTAGAIAIGKALENATSMKIADFANMYLFYPMQIDDAAWWTPHGLANGGSGLFLRTRDLAKFGQLYLDCGVWQGQQIISTDWIIASVAPHVILPNSQDYGYLWWLDELNFGTQQVETWITSGYGGQFTFVVPDLELVVAFTGHNYERGTGISNLFNIMRWQILAAID